MEPHHHHHHQQQPNTSESFPTLLTEIILEILLRLPVESVLRCKSVCKSWYSLISDPHFIKSHLAISTSNNQHRQIFSTNGRIIETGNLHDMLYDTSINNTLKLDYPFEHQSQSVDIVGCCNGLVCIAVQGVALFIWNPSTRKSYRLPPTGYDTPPGWYVFYAFGYDESTDDYKVIKISPCSKDKCETIVKIYSLKSGNWKNVGVCPQRYFVCGSGKFCNGALHWGASKNHRSSSYSWTIISLDLAKETFGEVLQPVYDEGDCKNLILGTLREQLCVLCDYPGIRADVWVMKDYGVKESWAKLVFIPYLTGPGRDRFYMPFCVSTDGKILLQFGWKKLIVYDSMNGSFSEIQNLDRCFEAYTFVESLVSPMPAAGLGDI